MLHFPMLALAICWMTAWWKATVLPGDKQRARLCPVAFHLVRLTPLQLWSRVFMFSGCFYDVFLYVYREQWGLGAQRRDVLASFWEVKLMHPCLHCFFIITTCKNQIEGKKKNPQPGCDHLNFKALASRHIYTKRSAIETLSHAPCF